jgi:hypothetical protein
MPVGWLVLLSSLCREDTVEGVLATYLLRFRTSGTTHSNACSVHIGLKDVTYTHLSKYLSPEQKMNMMTDEK